MNISFYLIIISSISFIYYGINSLFSKRMYSEYSRWGYENLRLFLAWCQLLGGCGLIIGMLHHSLNPLISVTSFLLTVMMLAAIVTRIKSKDGLILTLPSFLFDIKCNYFFSIYFLIFLLVIDSFLKIKKADYCLKMRWIPLRWIQNSYF